MSRNTPIRTISSLAEEMKHYAVQILDPRESLTTIQREAARRSFEEDLARKGVSFYVSNDDEPSAHRNYSCVGFMFPTLIVEDTAILADVQVKGLYPISLSIGEHIFIRFEPRYLKDEDMERWKDAGNEEYSGLNKGQTFSFRGRVTRSRYFFREIQPVHFDFDVVAVNLREHGNVGGLLRRLFRSL